MCGSNSAWLNSFPPLSLHRNILTRAPTYHWKNRAGEYAWLFVGAHPRSEPDTPYTDEASPRRD